MAKQIEKNIDVFQSIDDADLAAVDGGGVVRTVVERSFTTFNAASQAVRNVANPHNVLQQVQSAGNRFRDFVNGLRR